MAKPLKRDTCLIDTVDRDNLLAERIAEEKTPCLPSSGSCIYRVPTKFLSVNKEMYEPRVISIGPYHQGKQTLAATEKYKVLYLHSFLRRSPETSLRDYVKAIREIESEARGCYAEEISLTSDEFVRMMVLDGCFILELLLKYQVEESNLESKDCLFNATWKVPSLRRDMLLLENQIPFFVLDRLYNLSQSPKKANPLVKLALDFFDPILPTIQEANQYCHIGAKHLLDLLRNYLVDQFKPIDFGDNQFWEFTTCVTSLQEAGVKSKRKDSGNCLLDITFARDGKIHIPPFSFGESRNILFPNLIALEQCRRDYPDMITSHVILVNKLINCHDNGKLLSDKGITDCFFIKDDKVSPIVDKLCQEVVVDILRKIKVETGNSKIPSSKIEVHPLANGFAANMDPAETSRLFSAFNADGDRVITSSELATYLRVLGSDLMKVEGLESFIEKMDLHGNKKMEHNWLWDWIITMKKKIGLGTPAKNAAGNVIKKLKY